MVISSYVIDTVPEKREEVADALIVFAGVEVHGHEKNRLVVSIEADSINKTYEIATRLSQVEDVLTVNLVYCNFEDENFEDENQ